MDKWRRRMSWLNYRTETPHSTCLALQGTFLRTLNIGLRRDIDGILRGNDIQIANDSCSAIVMRKHFVYNIGTVRNAL